MSEIDVFKAKAQLPELLDRVSNGERFVITRGGRPMAELKPVVARDMEVIRKAIAELRNIRKDFSQRGVSLQDVLEPGESLLDLAHSRAIA